MKILKLFFVIISIIMISSSYSYAKDMHIDGTWLNELYIHVLKKSLSPKAASAVAQNSTIEIDSKSKTFFISWNFHEGNDFKIDNINKSTGRIKLKEDINILNTNIIYKNDHIVISDKSENNKNVIIEFSRISSCLDNEKDDVINAYVAQVVLVGKYEDEDGRLYTFGTNTLDWDGQIYEYKIQLDYVEYTPLDIIYVKKHGTKQSQKEFGFATNGALLQLYEYDDNTKKIGKLVYQLTKK
jgi:hypothetical protein